MQNNDAAQADALRQQEQNRQMELQRKLQEVQDQIKRYEQQISASRYARVLLFGSCAPGAKTAAEPRGVGSALVSLHPQTSEMATVETSEMAGVATVEASEMAAATVTVPAVQAQASEKATVEKSGLAVSHSSARFPSEVSEALNTFAGP